MADSAAPPAGRVFISYRREETRWQAGWLYDILADRFGSSQIFKDIDTIQFGDDFVEKITTAVGSCDVLLALIGEQWLTITDKHGRVRLNDPKDLVRLEIEAALTRNVRVIPILIEEAQMPDADQLPSSLKKLANRHALELSPSHFETDTSRLLEVINSTLASAATRAPRDAEERAERDAEERARHDAEERVRHRRRRAAGLLALAIAVAVIIGIVIANLVGHNGTTAHLPPTAGTTAHTPVASAPTQQNYAGPGGISVTTGTGWTRDSSAGIPDIIDYRAPGSVDTTNGIYFRIGIENRHPASSLDVELASMQQYLKGPDSPYRNVNLNLVPQATRDSCGVPAADIDFTETNPAGVRRHGLQRLFIRDGKTFFIELNAPEASWDTKHVLLHQLINSCHMA